MERWKRNLTALVAASTAVYVAYLFALYRESGGTMTITYSPPEWTFGLIVGAFIFVLGFAGGVVGLSLTRPDLLREGAYIRQMALLAAGLGGISAVMAVLMVQGSTRVPGLLIILVVFVGLWLFYARRNAERLRERVVIEDEREEMISLKTRALAGDTLISVVAALFLLRTFGLWGPSGETILYILTTVWALSYLSAQFYHRRMM